MRKRKISNELNKRESKRRATECLGIGVLLVLLCSCVSFNIGDWPSKFVYPHNDPVANWCGSIGAFCAYYLMYYLGPGVFVILTCSICFLVARLSSRPIGQPILRAIGLGLLTVAASSSFYLLRPHNIYSFPMGSGGVLGVATSVFLRSRFAMLGTFILIAATWIVGAVLLADSLILWVLGRLSMVGKKMLGIVIPAWAAAKQHSEVLSEIWQKLSARQKSLTTGAKTATVLPKPVGVANQVIRSSARGNQVGRRPGSSIENLVSSIHNYLPMFQPAKITVNVFPAGLAIPS